MRICVYACLCVCVCICVHVCVYLEVAHGGGQLGHAVLERQLLRAELGNHGLGARRRVNLVLQRLHLLLQLPILPTPVQSQARRKREGVIR
jgi:hypothetical protein